MINLEKFYDDLQQEIKNTEITEIATDSVYSQKKELYERLKEQKVLGEADEEIKKIFCLTLKTYGEFNSLKEKYQAEDNWKNEEELSKLKFKANQLSEILWKLIHGRFNAGIEKRLFLMPDWKIVSAENPDEELTELINKFHSA